MSKLDAAIAFCGLYEAELLVSLMLRFWSHPNSSDEEFVNYLLESATDVLTRSREGEQFLKDVKPDDMNFVAAVWYAEYCQLQDAQAAELKERRDWLTAVRRSLPACFCNTGDLL